MKTKKMLLTLASTAACLCFATGTLHAKSAGEKLDNAIETTKDTASEAKEAAKEKAKEAKETAEKKSDEVRDKVAETIKPS